jgi:hypothetical protein
MAREVHLSLFERTFWVALMAAIIELYPENESCLDSDGRRRKKSISRW